MSVELLPPQFMNWRMVNGDKLPCRPDGEVVDAHTPANWCDYQTAQQSQFPVAFVLTENDPWFFLDLDKCTTPDGQWTPQAQAIYLAFTGAMGEVSQSGTGLHILGQCQPHLLQDRRNKWDGWLEFYTQGRFIAFGDRGWEPIGGTLDISRDWTETLRRIVPERAHMGDLPTGVDPTYTGPEDDDELIAKMLKSSGGMQAAWGGKATVGQLWSADPILCQIYPSYDGDTQSFDHSSADAALMSHLAFWTGKDMPRMDRLFRRSALMRKKFEREDYRNDTIQGAARMCNKVYDRPRKADADPAALPPPEVYLTIPEMQQHFDGCTYIIERHRMLTSEGDLLKPEQFKAAYGGHIFQMNPDGTQPEKNAFVAFTENRTHRFSKVRRAVFDPELPPGSVNDGEINIFFPEDVVMAPGDISRFHNIMQKLLPIESDRMIMLAWMASCVQNPHRKFQWAPVLQGTEGNGKTFLMNCVAYAISEKFTHRPNPKELGATHNGWMERCLFALVEEVHLDGRRDMLDSLKWKVTNERIPIRAMATDEITVRNFTKWGFCTNFMDAVTKTLNDRRYSIFFTAQQTYADIVRDGMDGEFFPDLYRWAREQGGYAAIAYFLKHYPIPAELDPAGLCHRAPQTSSTAQAIQKSMGPVEVEIIEATQDNTAGFRGGFISSVALEKLLHQRGLRISRNKRNEIVEQLGYVRAPGLVNGRATQVLVWEDNKRPTIYMLPGTNVGTDTMAAYRAAQGYIG